MNQKYLQEKDENFNSTGSGSSSGSDSDSDGSSSSSSSSDASSSSSSSATSQTSQKPSANNVVVNQPAPVGQPNNNSEATSLNLSKSSTNQSSSGSDSTSSDSDSSSNGDNKTKNNETNGNSDSDNAHRNEDEKLSNSSPTDEEDLAVRRLKARQRARAQNTKKAVSNRKKKNWNSGTSDESDISPSNSEDERHSDHNRRPRRKAATAASSKKRSAAKTKNNRRQCYSSGDESDSDDESKRAATRRTATTTAVSYKEASEDEKTDSDDLIDVDYDESSVLATQEDDKTETIERVVQRRRGRVGDTGDKTVIYANPEESNENQQNGNENSNEYETQYLIKWKGWSYIHCTWESEQSLRDQKVKGIKKLENFMKREHDIEVWRRRAGIEDIDYYEGQLELQQELLKCYNRIERIIAKQTKADGAIDYLCKWECLPYSEATWEDTSLVEEKWSKEIAQFEQRESSQKTPSRHCRVLKYRPKFHQVKEQPEYIDQNRGLKLRDYQMDGLNWLILTWCKDNSVILADEMGLGKTIQTICFLYYLFKSQSLHGPFLCVVPLSTMTAWQREFVTWAPDMNVVTYLGDVQSREIIRQHEWCFDSSNRLKFNAILTTYEIVLKDKSFLGCINWASLLVDEAHRLKNDDSLLYKALYEFDTNHRLLITGTPLQNSLKELWALLHFIMPEKFVSWEEFEQIHENAAEKGYTKLHKQLEPFILRRVKKDVEKSLPAKVEQILRVEMTNQQKQYYKWILTKNFNALRKGNKGSMSTFLNIVIELKKCCNHAVLIKPPEFEMNLTNEMQLQLLLKGSGKLVLLDKLLCRLRETGHRVLIFSQMVRMLDILAEYLQKRHFTYQRLDGSIKGELRKQALDHFNADGSNDFCFLLSTRAGGLGINLATADTVIIFDSDWNPQNDLQAQARAHRIGQKNQVNIYRLVTARSVEEEIVERAKQKMVLDHLVIQRMDTTGRTVLDKNSTSSTSTPFNKDDLSAILKFGAEELFKDEPEGDGDDLICDIDEILRRAETRDEGPAMVGDELLSAFKVASFAAFDEDNDETTLSPATKTAYSKLQKGGEPTNGTGETSQDWDEIIPENLRKKIEQEERDREMEDLYLPPRHRKAFQQFDQSNEVSTEKKSKKRKKQSDDESDDDSGGGSDEERPRKRGRPSIKEKFCNFTDAELRRFIKSYRKFPAPLKRLEQLACDADLQEKSLADLKKIGEMLRTRCVSFLKEIKDMPPPKNDKKKAASAAATDDGDGEGGDGSKKRGQRAGFSIKFGGVSFNAKTLMASVEELAVLEQVIPNDADERQKWLFDIKTRPANFDVEWKTEDDSRLLCGIYQYGIGSWDTMKLDPTLSLADKILSNDSNKKPQGKHLQSRAEYLLKIIRKNLELKKGLGKTKGKKQRKPKEPKVAKSKDVTENDHLATSGDDENSKHKTTVHHTPIKAENENSNDKVSATNHHHHQHHQVSVNNVDETSNGPTKEAKKAKAHKEAKKAKKKTEGPMHFTANNEPRALDVLGDLDPTIFNECKEKMRPVKKALKALDNPDQTLSPEQQLTQTRTCLINIGKQIEVCLTEYKEPDKIKEWQSNLWYFVSKFTEFDARKLYKMYKGALKQMEKNGESSTNATPNADATKSRDRQTSSDEKRERKEKKRMQREKERKERESVGRYRVEDDTVLVNSSRDHARDESVKRRLEEGEIDDSSRSYKRPHGERTRDRSKDDHRRWNPEHDPSRIRRDSGNQPSPLTNLPSASRAPPYENRDGRPYTAEVDRWSQRDSRFSDHKRDRFDGYSRGGAHGSYHRERDNRDRDRDRRIDKRRYQPGYPNSHYMGHNSAYYPDSGASATTGNGGYRERYPSGGSSDWNRERDYVDYRRDYDRRPPPPPSSGTS